jgi:uncharacterized phage protein (TIGR02218 family)
VKAFTTPLRTLIEGRQFFRADLVTLTLVDGTVIRYTSADVSLLWGGHQFLSFRMNREKIKASLGLSVDQLAMTLLPSATDTLAGVPYIQAIYLGALDGATILLEKAYLSDWGDPRVPLSANVVGVLHGFEGSVSDLTASTTEVQLTVKSALELLNMDMPRELYQSTCLHIVYDAGCTLSRAAFTVTGAVTGSPSLNGFHTGLSQADGYFDQGVIALTSGAASGSRRTVKSYAGGTFNFVLPLPALPSVGDTFLVYPGCDRTQATCSGKFGNIAHFKGYPYIPAPETAV